MEAAKKMDKNNVRIEKVIQTVIDFFEEDVFGGTDGGGTMTVAGDVNDTKSDWTP